MQNLKQKVNTTLNNFVEETNAGDGRAVKRTKNYLNWIDLKTKLVKNEETFTLPEGIDKSLRRGSVVWIDFGFNIGKEFGGRHPAIILRRTKDSVMVLPLSSKEPSNLEDFHVEVNRVYEFKNMKRWGNVLRIKDVSIQRIDTSKSVGNVKGKILESINEAIEKSNSRGVTIGD